MDPVAGVTAGTRVYAVLGHPVGHSLSPRMQNAAFRAAGLDAVYLAFDIPPDRLEEALRGFHEAGVVGLNLTTPLKEAAFPLVARATPEAASVRAVNTLRREADGWHGDATDGSGFESWTRAAGIALRGERVLLLGAGGAARSLAPVLVRRGVAALQVLSRDATRARALRAWIEEVLGFRGPGGAAGLEDDPVAAGEREPWTLLVRALASAEIGAGEPAWWKGLAPHAPVVDLNYAGRAASTRARAEAEGRRFDDGLGLLAHQGARSFEFWTGKRAPIDIMEAALRGA